MSLLLGAVARAIGKVSKVVKTGANKMMGRVGGAARKGNNAARQAANKAHPSFQTLRNAPDAARQVVRESGERLMKHARAKAKEYAITQATQLAVATLFGLNRDEEKRRCLACLMKPKSELQLYLRACGVLARPSSLAESWSW